MLPDGLAKDVVIQGKEEKIENDDIEESKNEVTSQAGSSSGPKFTLFIKNLHQDVEEEDIRNLFTRKLPNVQVL